MRPYVLKDSIKQIRQPVTAWVGCFCLLGMLSFAGCDVAVHEDDDADVIEVDPDTPDIEVDGPDVEVRDPD
jgi:hypothetical protein